jgi:hypothetical protein
MSVSPRKYQRMFFYLARGHVEGMKYLSDTAATKDLAYCWNGYDNEMAVASVTTFYCSTKPTFHLKTVI